MKKIICQLSIALLLSSFAKAQVEPHFSQYYVYPMWLNPGLTGAMEGSYRVTAVYRNQWGSLTSPFSTAAISADVATEKNINFGCNILNQTAGTAGYNYLNGQLSVAYTGVKFGQGGYHRISMALQGGIIQRRFDPSKFQTGDQWVPIIGYNPGVPTADVLSKNSSAVFDAGAGVAYYDATPNAKANFFGGFSASHLNQPEDPFLSASKEKLPTRYTINAGIKFNLPDGGFIVPNALYMWQGNAQEKMIGAYVQLPASYNTDVMFGLNYRVKDAIVPFAGVYYNNFLVGLSYDINASQLNNAAKNVNSFEISISLIGNKTPENNFLKCPRL